MFDNYKQWAEYLIVDEYNLYSNLYDMFYLLGVYL